MKLRLLRGRILIREDRRHSSIIIAPTGDPRATVTHRGEVLAVGPPVETQHYDPATRRSTFHEVPLHYKVGDFVQFHFEATEKGRTMTWGEWEGVLCMAQREIDAVLESAGV